MFVGRITFPLLIWSVIACCVMAEPPVGSKRTALDDYVAKKDATYEWKLEKTIETGGLKTSVIQIKTQTWLTLKEVDRQIGRASCRERV